MPYSSREAISMLISMVLDTAMMAMTENRVPGVVVGPEPMCTTSTAARSTR